jgi:hypothetical protein
MNFKDGRGWNGLAIPPMAAMVLVCTKQESGGGLRSWLRGKTKHAGKGLVGSHPWDERQIAAVLLAKRSLQEE